MRLNRFINDDTNQPTIPCLMVDDRNVVYGYTLNTTDTLATAQDNAPDGHKVIARPDLLSTDLSTKVGQMYNPETGMFSDRQPLTEEFSSLEIETTENATIMLPAGAKISIAAPPEVADVLNEVHGGGVFSFGSDVPGLYRIRVDSPPYAQRTYEMRVVI